MATLLHIDSSALHDSSVSRAVTATFRKEWEAQHPDGTVIYRDLAENPLPHLTADGIIERLRPGASRSRPSRPPPARCAAELAEELESADAILIGTPMYNFTCRPPSRPGWTR